MARISVKNPIGTKVQIVESNILGIITAVFMRGRSCAYEFSYTNKNGDPTSSTVEEVEITNRLSARPIGFVKG